MEEQVCQLSHQLSPNIFSSKNNSIGLIRDNQLKKPIDTEISDLSQKVAQKQKKNKYCRWSKHQVLQFFKYALKFHLAEPFTTLTWHKYLPDYYVKNLVEHMRVDPKSHNMTSEQIRSKKQSLKKYWGNKNIDIIQAAQIKLKQERHHDIEIAQILRQYDEIKIESFSNFNAYMESFISYMDANLEAVQCISRNLGRQNSTGQFQ